MRVGVTSFIIITVAVLVTGHHDDALADTGGDVYARACASCHDASTPRTPPKTALSAMPTARIVKALETGVMRVVGNFSLDGPERIAVAEYLTGRPFDPDWQRSGQNDCAPAPWPSPDPWTAPSWNGWGNGASNLRFQSAAAAGLNVAAAKKLQLAWAFAFPGETITESQPTVVDGRLFVGARDGSVYALNATTGCQHWRFEAQSPVKNSVVIGSVDVAGATRLLAFFGDLTGTAYAVDANDGSLVWQRKVDPFPAARLMGSFMLADGQLFVPITATESTLVAATDAVCCHFRGSVVSLDPATGKERWRRYTVAEEPVLTGTNTRGNPVYGPSGATIWSAPTFDPVQGRIYVGTGENASQPATDTSDAILAIDVNTSEMIWHYQGLAGDAWNMSCGTEDKTNCPADAGLDFDMGSSPSLATLDNGRRILIAAQKSGVVHALDPDAGGKLLWQRKVAAGGILGGIEWGPANDNEHVYVALGDIRWNTPDLLDPHLELDRQAGGGVVALDLVDGHIVWQAPAVECGDRPMCSPAQTAAVSAIPGVVFAGGMSGHLRAFDASNGHEVWRYDTVREFTTVNGAAGRGGALDATGPVIVDGWVYVVSGYSKWGGLPGNVLLAFAVKGVEAAK